MTGFRRLPVKAPFSVWADRAACLLRGLDRGSRRKPLNLYLTRSLFLNHNSPDRPLWEFNSSLEPLILHGSFDSAMKK